MSYESSEETEARRAYIRMRQAMRTAMESAEEADERKAKKRKQQAERRARESKEETEKRRADMRRRQAERLARETEEESEIRKADMRWRHAIKKYRRDHPEETAADVFERFKHLKPEKPKKVSKNQTLLNLRNNVLAVGKSFNPEESLRIENFPQSQSCLFSSTQNHSFSHLSPEKFQQKNRQEEEEEEEEESQFHRQQLSYPDSLLIDEPCVTFHPENQQYPQVHSPTPVTVTISDPLPVGKSQCDAKQILAIVDHQRCVMSNLTSLWKSGKLCDACIGNGSSTVMVHKVVLSAICPKLLSVFDKEILSNKFLQVNFPEEVSTEALNAFAEYMYNGILDLDPDILEQLKIIAKRMDIIELEQLCNKHLATKIQQQRFVPLEADLSSHNVLIQATKQAKPFISTSENPAFLTIPESRKSCLQFVQPSTRQVINVKEEISEIELDQVQKETATVFRNEKLEVPSLSANSSGEIGFGIYPSIKNELLGPEDEIYRRTDTFSLKNKSINKAFTDSSSIPKSSTDFTIPFSKTRDIYPIKLKTIPSSAASDPSRVSLSIVDTIYSQSNSVNADLSLKTSSWQGLGSSKKPATSNKAVYPVELYQTQGKNLPLLTTKNTDDENIVFLYKTDPH